MVVYQNNDCTIEVERSGEYDAKVNVNGENLIWISWPEQEEFTKELNQLFDKYRI